MNSQSADDANDTITTSGLYALATGLVVSKTSQLVHVHHDTVSASFLEVDEQQICITPKTNSGLHNKQTIIA